MEQIPRFFDIARPVIWTLALSTSTCFAVTIDLESVGPMSPRNQAAWWSPIASRDGIDYVSYLSSNSPQDDMYIARRSLDGTWETRDTGVNATYDVGHTQTSLAIDGQSYIHVAYGMHNNAMRLVTSNSPNSISSGFHTPAPSVVSAFSGGLYTYPNMTTVPSGDIYMVVRDQRSSYSTQQGRLFRFDNLSRIWSELPPFAGQAGTTVYPDQILADAAGNLHILWEWAAGGAQAARHYGSYARFDPNTNTYYRADGTAYPPGPISLSTADIYQGLEGTEVFAPNVHRVQSAKMALDHQGRPLIAYGYSTTGTASGYQHRFARWDGISWTQSTITQGPFDTDKPWLAYSDGILRYYGALSPSDPLHSGSDDIFVRTSTNLGHTWSAPIPVTSGLDIQRPVGFGTGQTDRLYFPSISAGRLYAAHVTWDEALPAPPPDFPFFNSFDSQGFASQSGSFAIDPANGQLGYAASAGTIAFAAAERIVDIGASDFILSTRFVLNSANGTGNQITIGFGAFGTSSDFQSTEGRSFYLADWAVNSHSAQVRLRILAQGDNSDFWAIEGDSDGTNANGSSVVVGETYELRLTGAYVSDVLNLALSLFDAAGNQIGTSATAIDESPLAGQYFGYRNRIAGTDHQIDVSYDQFSLSAPPVLPGDYNGDGFIDAADYTVWRNSLGEHVANGTAADGNGNGVIDLADISVWKTNYGQTLGSASISMSSTHTVPEPSAWILLLAFSKIAIEQRTRRISSPPSHQVRICTEHRQLR